MTVEEERSVTPPASHRLLYLIAAVAQGGGPLITQPFVQRMLDAEQWGRVSLSISLMSVGLIVILAGLPLLVTRAYFEGSDGPRRARSLAGFGILLSAALGVGALAVFAVLTAFTGGFEQNLSLLIAFVSVGMMGGIQMCLAVLRAQQRAVLFVGITIGSQTLGHIAGLFSVLWISPTATAYMTAFAVVIALTLLWSLISVHPMAPFAFPGLVPTALRTALPMLPHSIALVIMLQGEAFLLTALHGPAFYGRYGAMLPMALGPIAVVLALANVWETTILAHQGRDPEGRVRRIQFEAVGVGVVLTIALSASAVFIANILARSPGDDQLQLARILPATAMGYIVFLIATTQLVAIGKTRLMAVVTPLVAVLDLVLMLIPGGAGDLFWVGAVKVGAFAVLGLAYVGVVKRYGAGLVEGRLLVGGLLASLLCVALMLLVPTGFWLGVVTFAAVAVIFVVAALWFVRTGRARALFG